jgi:succinylglutamic semialdehyde dehydrogenase
MRNTHFISGQWIGGTGAEFSSIDPASGRVVWTGLSAASDEIDRAVGAARSASDAWSRLALDERITFLHGFGASVRSRKNDLAETISREVGKPLWESKTEVDAVVGKIDQSIAAYNDRRRDMASRSNDVTSSTRYRPHGVVGVLGPFNFPAHLPNAHIVPALLAGNAVVFKPSEAAPLVARAITECWDESGVPPGVLNLVQGGRQTGETLVGHPGIDGVCFTGSFAGGSAISRTLSAEPGKILALEMGGNNPLVVHDISNLDAAVFNIIQSAYATAGQRCTCARRLVMVKGPQVQALLARLMAVTRNIRVGPFTDRPEPFMGPVISESAGQRILAAQEKLRTTGGKVLVESRSVGATEALLSPGLIDVTDVRDRSDTEVFGPLLQVIRVEDFDAAIREANNTQYGLAAGLLSDDRNLWERFLREARAGVVNWNRPTTGASGSLPFGGIGRSGNHRPSGCFAADYCSYPVASMEAESLVLPASLPPGIEL